MTTNTFTYTYSDKFGTDSNGEQDNTDRLVLKKLSQSNKESVMSFKNLLKKLNQETMRFMQLDKPQKDTLAENLNRTQYSNHHTDFRKLNEVQESLLLETVQYSNLATKQEHTHYTIAIKTTEYKEDCTLTPICSDCLNNGVYSDCQARKSVKHTHNRGTIPLSQYWKLALFGRTT